MAKRQHKPRAALNATRKERFLKSLESCGIVEDACLQAGISRGWAYEKRKTDEAFERAWDDAKAVAVAVWEKEAIRRAVKGHKRPVYQGKEHVGNEQVYSDTLLIFLLKGAKPETYRDKLEHSGPNGGAIPIVNLKPEDLNHDELAAIIRARQNNS